ncbi:type II secretion system F family protein [Marinobacter sp. SS21]|uniref:type II secretion system F family protein n=1 Tax=Marinobacter sp. SS21 TaxID=2979460 RepID=UPI00232C674C|nr:type II secretion system F family protein [Marinobacter sp. SS21]MDC0662280.1 type II secretion system F family protein [Marinobacter sp. SS21]
MMAALLLVGVVLVLLWSAGLVVRNLTRHRSAGEGANLYTSQRNPTQLGRWLRVLGLDLEPLLFVAGLVLCCTAVGLIVLTLYPDRAGFALLAGATFLPAALILMRDLVQRRAEAFDHNLVDVLDLLGVLTASGVPLLKALEASAKGGASATGKPLGELVARLRYGETIEAATDGMLQLFRTDGCRLFVMTLRLYWHEGGQLDALIRALVTVLRQRRSDQMALRGQLAGAKYALVMAAGLPYLLIPFLNWKEPDWLLPLTSHPAGPGLLYAAIVCQVIGFLWMRVILRSPKW